MNKAYWGWYKRIGDNTNLLGIVISSNYMTSHVIDLTWSEQFYIITHPKVDLVIDHLIYLI